MGFVEHLVLFRLRDDASGSSKEEEWVRQLNSLRGLNGVLHLKISQIATATGGLSFSHTLHVRFRNPEALNSYAVHPEHLKAVELGKSLCDFLLAIDWEVQEEVFSRELDGPSKTFFLVKMKHGTDPKLLMKVAHACKAMSGDAFVVSAGKDFSCRSREYIDFGYLLQGVSGDHLKFLQGQLSGLIDNFLVIEC